VSRELSPSSKKPYGVERAARVLEIPRSTVYARRKAAARTEPLQKRGPKTTALSDAALVASIRAVLAETPWIGEGYRKVWAMLRHKGTRTSKGRVLRLMREHQLLAPHRAVAVEKKAHEGTITTDAPDTMWGADASQTLTIQEGVATIFVLVDHCSTECVALRASSRGTRFEAIDTLRAGVVERFGAHGEGVAKGLAIRHDHGSPFVADLYQKELRFVGAQSSPAFVREPETNGVAERFFRTLKEQLLWIRRFATIEELQAALDDFRRRYNETWLLERHGYLTPAAAGAALRAKKVAA